LKIQLSKRKGFTCGSENTGIGTLLNALAAKGNKAIFTKKYKTRKAEVFQNPRQNTDSVRLLINLCERKESNKIKPPTCVKKVSRASKMISNNIFRATRKIRIWIRDCSKIIRIFSIRNIEVNPWS
jgi:hypothetical protein